MSLDRVLKSEAFLEQFRRSAKVTRKCNPTSISRKKNRHDVRFTLKATKHRQKKHNAGSRVSDRPPTIERAVWEVISRNICQQIVKIWAVGPHEKVVKEIQEARMRSTYFADLVLTFRLSIIFVIQNKTIGGKIRITLVSSMFIVNIVFHVIFCMS